MKEKSRLFLIIIVISTFFLSCRTHKLKTDGFYFGKICGNHPLCMSYHYFRFYKDNSAIHSAVLQEKKNDYKEVTKWLKKEGWLNDKRQSYNHIDTIIYFNKKELLYQYKTSDDTIRFYRIELLGRNRIKTKYLNPVDTTQLLGKTNVLKFKKVKNWE